MEKIGLVRYFTDTGDQKWQVREILQNPNISMWWEWSSGFCPHCKKKIQKKMNHNFTEIEILVKEEVRDEFALIEDIILYGQTMDGKGLFLTIDKYAEVFLKSKLFSSLVMKDVSKENKFPFKNDKEVM